MSKSYYCGHHICNRDAFANITGWQKIWLNSFNLENASLSVYEYKNAFKVFSFVAC